MKKRLLLLFVMTLSIVRVWAQGADCATAAPFCSGSTSTFPASTSTTAPVGPNYGCLGSQPNPAWYYLQIDVSGNLVLDMSSSAGVDIDFICWGPFASPSAACASGLTSSAVDCSFSTAATETCTIPSAVSGEFYMLLITNYSGLPTNISLSQSSGTGSTDCSILCNMTGLTATVGPCDPATNTFTLTGTISYTTPPTTGTLTVTNSCTGATQVFNAPFSATTTNYTLTGLPSNGAGCTVTATFSDDPLCTFTTPFTEPPPCTVTCAISAVSATPTACNSATLQYDVSGSVTFVNPPSSGTLTITNSCGGTPVVLSAPFTSPAAYTFTGLAANSASCNVTAVFSADPACTLTQSYTAPAPCPLVCNISAISATTTACDSATQQYGVSGTITFINAPATGTLTISSSCGGSPVVLNAPFTSPAAYTITALPANGASCTLTASFSAVSACTFSQTYTAPPSCIPPCLITALTATPSACDPLTDTYSVSGSITFTMPPSSGTLTVTNTCGGSQTFNAPFTSPLTYTLTGLPSDGSSCSVTAEFSAAVTCTSTQTYSAPPTCSLCPITTANNGPICSGDSLFLTASTIVGASYSWTGPGGFTSNLQNPVIPNVNAGDVGAYVATVTTGSPTCTSSSTTNFSLNPNPTPAITPSAGVLLFIGESQTLVASGGSNYNWYPSVGLTCVNSSCDSVIVNPTETTRYCVTITTAAGCVDSACIDVKVHIPCHANDNLDVPNAFTPNNDGFNDDLCLSGWDACVTSFEILIFDRWGEKIFYSKEPNFCWDGYYKGKLLDPGVFVYFIKASFVSEGSTKDASKSLIDITKKGNITLIR